MVNLSELADRVKASGRKKSYLAEKCGLTRQGLQNKLDGKTEFNVSEARVLKDALELSNEETMRIFFA